MLVQGPLHRTPLYDSHLKLGGRMGEFAGWSMPVQYTSIIEEHHIVRNAAGLFDISHMGEFYISGSPAAAWLNGILTNDINKLQPGEGQYTFILNDSGGVIDDLIAYRLDETEYLLVVNAGKIEENFAWMCQRAQGGIHIENRSDLTAAMALQGPASETIFRETFVDKSVPKRNQITPLQHNGKEILVARTGYTGEDGFELFLPNAEAPAVWELLLQKGKPHHCTPAGLGARDTLRLEACLPLNGGDLSESITPLEAGLGKFVSFSKTEDFPGRVVLGKNPIKRALVAFVLEKTGPPPRAHYPVLGRGRKIGEVTSGTASPTLKKGIGLALIDRAFADNGTLIEIEIRGRRTLATVQPKPLYKRPS